MTATNATTTATAATIEQYRTVWDSNVRPAIHAARYAAAVLQDANTDARTIETAVLNLVDLAHAAATAAAAYLATDAAAADAAATAATAADAAAALLVSLVPEKPADCDMPAIHAAAVDAVAAARALAYAAARAIKPATAAAPIPEYTLVPEYAKAAAVADAVSLDYEKQRLSFRMDDDVATHGALDAAALKHTRDGATAYTAATLKAAFTEFDGTALEVASVETVKRGKGNKVNIKVVPVHLQSKGIFITMNTTAALDYRKVFKAYIDKFGKLAARNLEKVEESEKAKNDPAARRAVAMRKIERAAAAYERNLVSHGMSADMVKAEKAAFVKRETAKLDAAA